MTTLFRGIIIPADIFKEDHQIEPLQLTTSSAHSISTPLPKPSLTLSTPLRQTSLLRHSVSISSATRSRRASLKLAGSANKPNRRSSYTVQGHNKGDVSVGGLGALQERKENGAGEKEDETPTAGIRVLQAKSLGVAEKKLQVRSGQAKATDGAPLPTPLAQGDDVSGGFNAGASRRSIPDAAFIKYLQATEKRLEEQLRQLDGTLETVRPLACRCDSSRS